MYNIIYHLQTRARGSLKRRPPSRAHRKKAFSDLEPSNTPQTSVSSAMTSNSECHTIAADTSKTELSEPAERLQDQLVEKDEKKVPMSVEKKEADISTVSIKTDTSYKASDSAECSQETVGTSPEERINRVTPVDNKNFLEAQKRASDVSKAKNSSRAKSHSLFDSSDSDDLFGETKKKKAAKNSLSTGSLRVSKMTGTNSKSHSLFEDDDDDDGKFCAKVKEC